MTRSASIFAPAKINLDLRVLGRRPDGFHEIRTVFQSIDFGDSVRVSMMGRGITLDVDGPDLGPVEENLAYRAAAAFVAASGAGEGAAIELEKRIPAGAGLGGGSSDAAAVLKCLNHLAVEPLSMERLNSIAASLGSDVPFFLVDGTRARASGRGELLEVLPALPPCAVTVLVPPVHVATGPAYTALKLGPVAEEEERAEPAAPSSWAESIAEARNDFEEVVASTYAPVRDAIDALDGPLVMLSGSGGACFSLDPSAEISPLTSRVDDETGVLRVDTCTLVSVPHVVV